MAASSRESRAGRSPLRIGAVTLGIAAMLFAGLAMQAPKDAAAAWTERGWTDSRYRPAERSSLVELGLWSATYENDNTSEPAYGIRLGFGLRDAARATFFPQIEFGSFGRNNRDRTIFNLYPLSVVGELIAIGDEHVGFSLYLGAKLGLGMQFVQNESFITGTDRETLFYLPVELELGFRFYFETIYLFGAIDAGWHVGIGSSIDNFTPTNLSRGQGLIGVGFLF